MKRENHDRESTAMPCGKMPLSRRRAIGVSGLAIAGLLPGLTLGRKRLDGGPNGKRDQERGQRLRSFRDRMERMRNAGEEEREQIMAEFAAQRRQEAIDRYKERLGWSDAEWKVIGPRLEAVYDCVHPNRAAGRGMSEIDSRKRDLQRLLHNKEEVLPDRIKAGLRAVRAAQERARQELGAARQSLRDLLTLRQEAELVLDGLLV